MDDGATIRVDGQAVFAIPADDRGLAYGDGVFRTLCVIDGRAIAKDHQLARLSFDCERLDLMVPSTDDFDADVEALCGTRGRFVVKIMVTRGSAGRGYTPPASPVCRRIVTRSAMPSLSPAPLELSVAEIRLAEQPALAGIKHLNRLEQVLARAECERRQHGDLAMCDTRGRLISTTMRNLFFADASGCWVTPSLADSGVAGATRARLMHTLGARGRFVVVDDITPVKLSGFVAAIACNSVGGARPVTRLGAVRFDKSPAMAADAAELLDYTA